VIIINNFNDLDNVKFGVRIIKTQMSKNLTIEGEKIMSELFNLKGKVAIVTGASSGLGVQFATALAKQGADIARAVAN